MKKVVSSILVLAFLMPMVFAERLVPADITASIDFTGTTDFTLYLPNGFQRHFNWNTNETHSDVTMSHTIYTPLNETKWCIDNSQLGEYQYITTRLADVMISCKDAVVAFNQSQKYLDQVTTLTKEAEAAKTDKATMEGNLGVCDQSRTDLKDDKTKCETEKQVLQKSYDTKLDDYDRCQSALNNYQDQVSESKQCTVDLAKAEKDKTTYLIAGAAAAAVICYMMWKKGKKEGAPSEQLDSGHASDRVNYYPRQPKPTFPEDGPSD